ncbi:MAG: pilus assembly protein PilM [Patescibacteria group bacterium]
MALSEKLLSVFPLPSSVTMPAVGLDISDHSIKFLELVHSHTGFRVGRFGTKEIPEGIVVGGMITRRDDLVKILAELKDEHKLTYVRASLPEEPGYIFTTIVPAVSPDEIRSLLKFKLEEHVPISPTDAVIDFDTVATDAPVGSKEKVVAVSVFPEGLAQIYVDLLHAAGLTPVSLEIEAQAIARAVVPQNLTAACMSVDVGRTRSCISVVAGGVVRFTTTVDIGGDGLSLAIAKALPNAKEEEILVLKNEEGLAHTEHEDVKTAMYAFAKTLRNEIERYYIYWQTHPEQNQKLPHPLVDRVFLSGGYANTAGLSEFLSEELLMPVIRANVWENAFSLDDHVPPLEYRHSLSYASSIGLALHQDT